MNLFLAELIGTMLLIILGDGVVAGVLLSRTKSQNAGWLVIAVGWGLAVVMAVYAVGRISGAHLNPALTLALAVVGDFAWEKVPVYISAQFIGGFLGAVVVYLHYLPHWARTEDADTKLAVFCNAPAVRDTVANILSEVIATFVLVFVILGIGANEFAKGLNPLIVGGLIVSIGLSLGGTTGYAINPARDFAPRVAHFVLPIPNKRDSDWAYAWIPVIAPILGAILGAVVFKACLG
jgi:glycerol uptake facilitator protein